VVLILVACVIVVMWRRTSAARQVRDNKLLVEVTRDAPSARVSVESPLAIAARGASDVELVNGVI